MYKMPFGGMANWPPIGIGGWLLIAGSTVLVNQFHGNFCSKTPSCGKIKSDFRDVK